MIDEIELRPAVQWFAERMEETLRRHDDKGGWDDMAPITLLRLIDDEAKELFDAWCAADCKRMVTEAVDVADYCMMVADVARRLE